MNAIGIRRRACWLTLVLAALAGPGCLSADSDLEAIARSLGDAGGQLSPGAYDLRRDLDIRGPLQIEAGAVIRLDTDRMLTFDSPPEAGRRRIFQGPGQVRFLRPGVVYPDWWGDGTESIARAIRASAQGSRIELAGRYESVPLKFVLPGDEGKALVGTGGPGERFDDVSNGASIYLAGGQDKDVIRIEGRSNPADRAGIRLSNLKVNGAGKAQKSGHCLAISNVKDILIENLYLEDCAVDGLNASERGVNQIEASYLEVQSAGRDGVSLGSAADSNFVVLKLGTNGRFGLQASGGNNQFGSVQAYLNTRNGVVVSGDNKRFGTVRADENGEAGVRVTGSGNSFQVVEVSDNGKAQLAKPAARAGLLLGGSAAWNHIGYVTARSRPGRDWQSSLVYLSSTGEQNHVVDWRQPPDGQRLLGVNEARWSSRSLTLRQLAVQRLESADAHLIDPWLGEVVELTLATQVTTLEFAREATLLDGTRLSLVVTQGASGEGRLVWPDGCRCDWQPSRAPRATSAVRLVSSGGKWQALHGNDASLR